jgi:hypothetical protein
MTARYPLKQNHTERTTCVVFFGTPLNSSKLGDFHTLLRRCATVELEAKASGKKVEKLTSEESTQMLRTLDVVKNNNIPILSIFERKSSLSDERRGRFMMPRFVSIVILS